METENKTVEEQTEKVPARPDCLDKARDTAARVAKVWKETTGNPCVKKTQVTRYDLYFHPDDETPIDSFEFKKSRSFTVRALAFAGSIALLLLMASGSLIEKAFGKK